MAQPLPSLPKAVKEAIQFFKLEVPFSREELTARYHQFCRIWDPARYAGHTNNPEQYMQMYKKGELKTKEIQSAFDILQAFFELKAGNNR